MGSGARRAAGARALGEQALGERALGERALARGARQERQARRLAGGDTAGPGHYTAGPGCDTELRGSTIRP